MGTKLFSFFALICPFALVRGADNLTPNDVVLPSENATQETLNQTANSASLRVAGLDLYPRAYATAMYDDNILIRHENALSDLEWTLSPGMTIVAGDVSTYLPGPVTLDNIRGLLNYSLVEDSSKPTRFLGVDYAPAVNLFTDHSQYNNFDQTAGLSAGYTFSKFSLGLDQDFSRLDVKDNGIGSRITRDIYNTQLRGRYDVNDRSSFQVNGQYYRLDYRDVRFQGYQEFRNEDWYDRQVGARLNASVGAAFGLVYPLVSADQTYQQALLRGIYRISGKLNIAAHGGVEYREYDTDKNNSLNPVFSLMAIYSPLVTTTITLEGHRRDQPSYDGNYNYQTLGFSAGVRQQILGRIYAGLSAGYDNIDYTESKVALSSNRADNYFSLRTSLDYEFNRHLMASLFYVRQQDDSSIHNYTFDDNMVGARVTWRY